MSGASSGRGAVELNRRGHCVEGEQIELAGGCWINHSVSWVPSRESGTDAVPSEAKTIASAGSTLLVILAFFCSLNR
jgi:hypothetical protein